MIRGECSRISIKKRKWTGIEFTNSDTIPSNHQGTEPLIIKGSVGKTLIHKIYVDNRISVNIIYEHYISRLSKDDKEFVKLATSSEIGFKGQSVWLKGKISLPFTLVYFKYGLKKRIITEFLKIKAPLPYNMFLGRTDLWQLQAISDGF